MTVERATHRLLVASRVDEDALGREWYDVTPQIAALAVVEACTGLGIRPAYVAGIPGAVEREMSDVEGVLAEPANYVEKRGRLDREQWAPQGRSFSY